MELEKGKPKMEDQIVGCLIKYGCESKLVKGLVLVNIDIFPFKICKQNFKIRYLKVYSLRTLSD